MDLVPAFDRGDRQAQILFLRFCVEKRGTLGYNWSIHISGRIPWRIARTAEGTTAWTQAAGNAARSKTSQPNKLLAALSYLSVLFILPFLFCKDDKFAMFHARQGAILFAITAVGEVLGSAFGLGWIVTLMHLYWIYKGMTNANDGKVEPLPYIGNLFSKQ